MNVTNTHEQSRGFTLSCVTLRRSPARSGSKRTFVRAGVRGRTQLVFGEMRRRRKARARPWQYNHELMVYGQARSPLAPGATQSGARNTARARGGMSAFKFTVPMTVLRRGTY